MGRDRSLERVLRTAHTDAVFEVGQFYGMHFGVPAIAWIPDLQHRCMPNMFTRINWWRRDLAFRMQIRSGRTLMVSSQSAREDMERFFPGSRGRAHVVRFAIDIDIASYRRRAGEVRARHGVPERFLFLPNQFWRHKNHAVIVQALAHLRRTGKIDRVPPIILSGSNRDFRNPGHFDTLMRASSEAGVDSHFRYLGFIPYDDVLCLAACCDVLINPSSFEGWSTPIEEAKAVGAPLMLSDIAIHREQAPGASFFDPASSEAAARILLDIGQRPSPIRATLEQLACEQGRRLDDHAASLLGTVRAAAQGRIR
jgi:glycosyltransferase involved in cell wall biosynthesis